MSESLSNGNPSPSVEVRNLTKAYGNLQVLRGVSLRVDQGHVAVIIGPSGGGKSTLLRCINYLTPPDAGEVWIDGRPFGTWTDEQGRTRRQHHSEMERGRAKMPMVFQSLNLFQHLTALGNVTIGQMVVLRRSREEAEAIGREVLARVGLLDKLDAYPANLSGGQQQRVGIARALALNPEIILFDEPTSSLDPERVGEVLTIIRELAGEGMTMLIVTHEMGFARQIGSHVYFVDDGLVLEEGPPAQVLADPINERTRDFMKAVLR